jgi:serine/threonine protein kinase
MIPPPPPDLLDVAVSICAAEQWILIDKIGDGGFKKVFRVQASHGEHFALKVLLRETPRTDREWTAMLRCSHPSIARLFHRAAHEWEGHRYDYFLEEYLGGGTLLDRIQQKGLLSVKEAVVLGQQLIDALAHLHELQLVHRDIKPHNIMYRADGNTPVLSDFGIVRDLSAPSLTQTILMRGPGTPLFASPEQLNNQKDMIDWRADQFSLGVTLCLSAFGVHPYQHAHEELDNPDIIERVALRQKRDQKIIQRLQNAGLPCLVKMTSAWPVGRYTSPDQLAVAWSTQERMNDRLSSNGT